jgi:putative transposase
MGRPLLQSDRNAMLFIEVLRSYVAAQKFQLHDFVVMPNHVHLLVTVGNGMTLVSLEEGIWVSRRGLATGVLGGACRGSAELLAASGIHSGEPG